MNYQRILCVLLCVCMLACLMACQNHTQQPPETESQAPAESQEPTEGEELTESQTPTEGEEPAEGSDNQDGEESCEIRILTLEKTLHTYYEWEDGFEKALVRSEYGFVTLGQEDAEVFPQMAEVLSQKAAAQETAMLDEFDGLVLWARKEYSESEAFFEPYVSTLDVLVRRADSTVISLLWDSYSHYGQIENYRAFHGSNYDTQTGKELALKDVVKDVNHDLAEAVEKELTSLLCGEELYSDTAVEDYFANTPDDGISWTLDYTGVTFYFEPGALLDGGAMTATVSFAAYPELFYEKYMTALAEYTVEVPLDISFFVNWDTEADCEALSVSGWYDDTRNHYMDYGVYTQCGEYFEECYVYDFHPYYVKAAGGNYLYLFCEDFEEGMRQMRLVAFALNEDGSVTKSGERNVSPSWLADNKFIVPTNPGEFILDDIEQGTEKICFAVGNDGIPSPA